MPKQNTARQTLASNPQIDSDVLLVEGPDDFHFTIAFLNQHGLFTQIRCQDSEGIDRLLRALPQWLKPSDTLKRLGIIVDADQNVNNRWAALRNVLLNAGYSNVPDVAAPEGTIIAHNARPTVGVWLMPDNVSNGMLENFISALVPADDKLWNRAMAAVQQIAPEERLFSGLHEIKAQVHTWLAWQKDPGMPMGRAVTLSLLSVDAPQAQALAAWLRTLFTTGNQS